MNRRFLIIVCWLMLSLVGAGFLVVRPAAAQEAPGGILVTPSIIDEQANARDLIEKTLKLKNLNQNQAELYALVNDLDEQGGEQPFVDPTALDKGSSLARWIEFYRGVIVLAPGEEKELPLKIRVNLSAKPGKYHAQIVFAAGSNRDAAAATKAQRNQPRLLLNLTVAEYVVERAENDQFRADKNFNFKNPVGFSLALKNIGNAAVVPNGSVIIYDRREREVAELKVNEAQSSIGPQQIGNYHLAWASGSRIGKFKARLSLTYGNLNTRDIEDTIFFWVLPWWFLVLFVTLVAALLLSLYFLVKRSARPEKVYIPVEPAKRSETINLRERK